MSEQEWLDFAETSKVGKVIILHGTRIDPDAFERMKADFKMAHEAVDAGTCTYNIDPNLQYQSELAERRGRTIAWLSVALMIVSALLVLQNWRPFG